MKNLSSEELKSSQTSTSSAQSTPAQELSLAVEKLKHFAEQNKAGMFSNVHHFDDSESILTEPSGLKQTIHLIRCFNSSKFSKKSRHLFKLKKKSNAERSFSCD